MVTTLGETAVQRALGTSQQSVQGSDIAPLRFAGLFRDGRDSVVVKVYGRNGSESVITLRRDVIDPYLETVASVSAALRKNDPAVVMGEERRDLR